MKFYRIYVFLFCIVSSSIAVADTIPSWLDTLPPVITVTPKKIFHTAPFTITVHTNEEASIWIGVNSKTALEKYTHSIAVTKQGTTTVYFYAEDMFGNITPLDSATYILDWQPPHFHITPAPGIFTAPITITIEPDEPCRLYRYSDAEKFDTVVITESIDIHETFSGYIAAIDEAGNISRSEALTYIIDTTTIAVTIQPAPGMYNRQIYLSFDMAGEGNVFFTFDPNALPQWFTRYTKPVACPYGITLVRYFAENTYKRQSSVFQATFVIDTIAPSIRHTYKPGKTVDTLVLWTKEKSVIRYTVDKQTPLEDGLLYTAPLTFQRQKKVHIRANATDEAGNVSSPFFWEYTYDTIPPVIRASHQSGVYTKPFTLTFFSSEPAKIFYTLDGTAPDIHSSLYRDSIFISKIGKTEIRFFAIDESDNRCRENQVTLVLDPLPPKIKAHIERGQEKNTYIIELQPDETAVIYYSVGKDSSIRPSKKYTGPIVLDAGQILQYLAVDNAGNRSDIFRMDDLLKPIVTVTPDPGIYNHHLSLYMAASVPVDIYYRTSPQNSFILFTDTVRIQNEGTHTVEYYYTLAGKENRSPVQRVHYVLDWTPPEVSISLKKGVNDSVAVFFTSNENVSIYYTTDGTSPYYSATTNVAGNRFNRSNDRVSVVRNSTSKLAFYAEDIARNQSALSVLDIFKPRAVSNIPSGSDRVYDRILSLTLFSFDDHSQIYYERHNKTPTLESAVFKEPITLVQSDTIRAFVVDASGYRGQTETFIYRIDLPPSPAFTVAPKQAGLGTDVVFDASETIDNESPVSSLTFLWDFDTDGEYEKKISADPTVSYTYKKPGRYEVTLTVTDSMNRTASVKNQVDIIGVCPDDMLFIPQKDDQSFCIDRYEWPNKNGVVPQTNVSWIRAKLYCYDEGKRLCKQKEWEQACRRTMSQRRYPYGYEYTDGKCPTEGSAPFKSGQFQQCHEGTGIYDMIGNVWEWVSDKHNGEPTIVGGAFNSGQRARCTFYTNAGFLVESETTGFRCCK